MRLRVLFLLAPLLLQARQSPISFGEAQDGWLLLFDGETAFGWTGATSRWHFDNNALSCDASSGLLRTSSPFADLSLKLEFNSTADDAPTIYLRTAGNGKPRETGYALKLGNSDPAWPAGSIVDLAKSTFGRVSPNAWHSLQIDAIGDTLSVTIDGRPAVTASDPRAKAGYLALQCGNSRAQFRNLKIKPLTLNAIFNGTDLSGWKSIGTPPPKPKGTGLLSKMSKVMIPVPAGKPKEALWSVKSGMIQGVKGPGQLESEAQYDNFVLRIAAPVPDAKNARTKTAVVLRGAPGQLASGYSIPLDNSDHSGGIAGLQRPRETLLLPGGTVYETIIADGRHIAVWMDGYPVTDWTDTRVDASTPKTGARTAPGPIAIEAPGGDAQVNIQEVSLAAIPKDLGKQKPVVAAAPPAPKPVIPTPAPVAPTPQATTPQPNPAADFMAQQQRQQAEEKARQQQVGTLMTQAIRSNDPNERANIYGQILRIDPNNMPAAQGLKDAQDKIDQQRAEQQKQQQESAKQTQDQQTKQQQYAGAMDRAERNFLHGNLAEASRAISVADRIMPGNPATSALMRRISGAYALQSRIHWIAGGGGVVALLASIVYLWRRRKRGGGGGAGNKQIVLEVVDGIDRGKRYTLNGDVSRIGAVAQDGGARNEIVVRDAERMVSRFHCEIHRKHGNLFLVDCNSSNGTYVDKKRAPAGQPVRLKNGSRVELGRTCALQVRFEKPQR